MIEVCFSLNPTYLVDSAG